MCLAATDRVSARVRVSATVIRLQRRSQTLLVNLHSVVIVALCAETSIDACEIIITALVRCRLPVRETPPPKAQKDVKRLLRYVTARSRVG